MPPIFVGLPSKGEQIESLSSFFTDSAINTDGELSDILVTAAQEATKLFSNEETKEIGPFISEFSALLQQLESPKEIQQVVDAIIKTVVENKEKNTALRLKTLNNLYNFFPSDSKFRYQLFLQILKYAVESNNTFAVISVFPTVNTLFEEWRATDEQKRNIYKEMHNVLLANSNGVQSKSSYVLLRKYLEAFESASQEELAEAKQTAVDASVLAIKLEDVHQYDDLLELKAVKQLKTDNQFGKIYELLELFTGEKLDSFDSFNEKNPGFLVSVSLSPEDCLKKIRLLSLTTLAAENNELPYAQIAKTLNIEPDQVESWVISAISAELIDAKIDQLNQIVLIHHCTQRVFNDAQWKQLQTSLNTWRGNVQGLLSGIQSSRGFTDFIPKPDWK